MKHVGLRGDQNDLISRADLLTAPGAYRRGPALLLPLYIYPANAYSNADYNRVIAAARAYPGVQLNVALNNASGPGGAQDGNYLAVIRRLRACSNVRVLGYVDTNYGDRSAALVRADIDAWRTWYAPDGIFLDRLDTGTAPARVAAVRAHTDYAHGLGLSLVIGNPGGVQQQVYFDARAVDVTVIYESPALPTEAYLKGDYGGGYSDYPTAERAALVYGQGSFSAGLAALLSRYTGMWLITSASTYGALPTYLEEMLAWLAGTAGTPVKPLLGVGQPTAPDTGAQLFARSVGGRVMPAWVGPSGLDSTVQASLARNGVTLWTPGGGGINTIGVPSVVVGTITTPPISTAAPAFANSIRRWRVVSTTATAGSVMETRGTQFAGLRGMGPGIGGFWYLQRFSEAVAVPGQRLFVGLTNATGAWAGTVSPQTQTNIVGVGHDAADANLRIYSAGAAAAGAGLDLGALFPANVVAAVYELALFCVAGGSWVRWQVTRLDTGDTISGELADAVLPAGSTPLTPRAHLNSGAVASAVTLDQSKVAFETDY